MSIRTKHWLLLPLQTVAVEIYHVAVYRTSEFADQGYTDFNYILVRRTPDLGSAR